MTRKAWDHGGASAAKRGYGRQHRKLREQLLNEEPLCRMCKAKGRITPARVADHVVPIAKGGALHDINNLQPLCIKHHEQKTLEEQGKRFRRRIALDGWPDD